MNLQKMHSKIRQRRLKEGDSEGAVYSFIQNGILFHNEDEVKKFTDSKDEFHDKKELTHPF